METTRESLLARVRNRSDHQAWREFHDLYVPLLYHYARARGLSREDAEEVRDQCLEVIARNITTFEYDKQKGGFKNWLRRMVNNKVVDLLRRRHVVLARSQDLRALRDPEPSPAEIWEQHWQQEHLRYCVKQVRGAVSERDYQVFQMLLFEECPVKEVCARLRMTPNQVYKAKARVLQRVRLKLAEFEMDVST